MPGEKIGKQSIQNRLKFMDDWIGLDLVDDVTRRLLNLQNDLNNHMAKSYTISWGICLFVCCFTLLKCDFTIELDLSINTIKLSTCQLYELKILF